MAIGEVCRVVGGSTPKTSVEEYWGGEIPWITPNDLSGHVGKYISRGERSITESGYQSCSTTLMPSGSVVFSSRAPIGYTAIAVNPVCTNQGFKSFVPSDAVRSDYLYWYLLFAAPDIQRMGSGTTFSEISGKVAKSIPLILAPLEEQQQIVEGIEEQLSRLEAGVESLQRARRNLARLRASTLAAAANGRLDMTIGDSPIEPESWRLTTLGELLTRIEAGKSFKAVPRPAVEDEWGVIKVSAMTWGSFRQGENKALPAGMRFDPTFEIAEGDLLLSRANTSEYVGATVLVPATRRGLLLSDKSMRLHVREGVNKRWLWYALLAPPLRSQMSAVATGTSDSMRNISQEKVRRLSIKVPSLDIQNAVVMEVDRRLSVIDALKVAVENALTRSETLRGSVLRAAFSGDLREARK